MTMNRPDIQATLQDAIRLAQSGQRTEARRLLEHVIEADPKQELAWMWLATVSTSQDERIACLERVLTLNPGNPTAQDAYAQLTGQSFTSPVLPPSDAQRRKAVLVRGGLIVATMFVFLLIAIFVLAGQLVGDDDFSSRPAPTTRPVQVQSPTQPPPTRVVTPLPTRTPGPSPTPVWLAPPPTWTLAPTNTPAPSRTPAPSSTLYPTSEPFMGPYVKSATAEFVLTSDAGPATVEAVRTRAAITPTSTLTPEGE
jgi:hypothetical protein